MKLFKSLTPESLLAGLGIAAMLYIITPVIKELAADTRTDKKIFSYYNGKGSKVIFDKSSLH